jgi:hypothetical protein
MSRRNAIFLAIILSHQLPGSEKPSEREFTFFYYMWNKFKTNLSIVKENKERKVKECL